MPNVNLLAVETANQIPTEPLCLTNDSTACCKHPSCRDRVLRKGRVLHLCSTTRGLMHKYSHTSKARSTTSVPTSLTVHNCFGTESHKASQSNKTGQKFPKCTLEPSLVRLPPHSIEGMVNICPEMQAAKNCYYCSDKAIMKYWRYGNNDFGHSACKPEHNFVKKSSANKSSERAAPIFHVPEP